MFTYRAFSFCLYRKKGSLRIRLRFQRFLSFSENSSFQNTTEAQKRNLNRKPFHCTLILQVIFNVPDVSPFAFQPSWEIADPIISLVGACVVLLSTCPVLRQSINILLEGMGFRILMNNSEILDIFRRPVAFDPFVYGSAN